MKQALQVQNVALLPRSQSIQIVNELSLYAVLVARARTLLARPDLPGLAVMFAIWGLALGTGLQGRSDAVSTATGAWTDTVVQRWGETAPPAESSMLMFVFAHVRVVVLRLAG